MSLSSRYKHQFVDRPLLCLLILARFALLVYWLASDSPGAWSFGVVFLMHGLISLLCTEISPDTSLTAVEIDSMNNDLESAQLFWQSGFVHIGVQLLLRNTEQAMVQTLHATILLFALLPRFRHHR